MNAKTIEAWARTERRMQAGTSEDYDPAKEVGADDAAHLLAGMDLPARDVLRVLTVKVIAAGVNREDFGLEDIRGMVLAAFLFGWESRS